ncbi:hypothetical protein TrLO_g2570 [Triparma laevis f. longispina]|uniref:ABC transporter domain-containing protein n=1 Tax=Triparma laevis f. longispina TaxID=1714387 RepID=A0A9W7DXF4_9STRA|nr:hypothetical protein TrLO_g2570 [Triparma laevis f. longispina]
MCSHTNSSNKKPVRLTFSNLRYSVPIKGQALPKSLLTDIKGDVTSGHVLAILGPSGAGKTTLLNMLTLQQSGGTPSGNILVNGEPLTTTLYNRTCAYVEQSDTLWASLTAKDHLDYAMELFRPNLDKKERDDEVEKLIKAVGLEEFQDVRAGSEIIRGLSSGNKRRLSVALALVKQPSILFLDEPTSGVDSASAVRMMTFLKNVAASNNIAVVCTIHQPPASVFAGFDNAMILSMGRVVYFGKANKMSDYLTEIGSPPTADTNPSEFILDLVNTDFTSRAGVKNVIDKWAETSGEAYGCTDDKTDGTPLSSTADSTTMSFMSQLGVLTNRSIVVAKREPLAYLVRIVANFSATFFFGIIYIETRNKRQDQVNPRTFFLMFCMGIPMQFILVSNFIYHFQWLSLKKEVKDGMYHPAASALASWVVQVPMMFVLALASMLPMYVLGDLAWSSFPIVLTLYALAFWSFEGLAQMLSVFPNVIYGLFAFLNMYFTAFLFCGMFVDPTDVIWPIRAFCYFLPLGWTLESYMYGLYHDLPESSGTIVCNPGDALPNGGLCTAQGFYCFSESDPAGAVCYGKTGDEILNSLSVQFTIFGDEGNYARNIGFIVAFGILCRIGYVGAIYVLTMMYGGQEPKPPSESYSVMAEEFEEDEEETRVSTGMVDVSDEVASVISVTFAFRNIQYSIKQKKKKDAKVLENVSAAVSNGEVLAIVGPSGAGKTILLETLTFNKGPGAPAGEITLNGMKMTRTMFVEEAIYVPREDNLWPTLSPYQHLDFAYKMYRTDLDTAAKRKEAVDELLSVTGLTSCQDTKAGGFLFKGLSGGQRRRLSLAIALVKEPRVIVLDEPTSGLDSAAAAAIISLLGSIAKRCNAAIVCTIHQPSALVFAGFHKVLVLSEGRVAYCGDRGAMARYFDSISVSLSHGANPAEAVLDLVSKDTSSVDEVNKVLDSWQASNNSKAVTSFAKVASGGAALPPKTSNSASTVMSTMGVFQRQVRLAFTDPLQFTGRLIAIPQIVSFFGLVYVASHESNQKQVPFRLFYMWWVLALPSCMGITTLIGTNRDTFSVMYEIRAGMYKAYSYALSTTLVQIPALIFLSACIMVCAFAIGGWPFDQFLTTVLVFAINLMVFDSLAQLLAVLLRNPVIGMLAYLGVWSSSIVFCGLVFRGGDVIWPFRTFFYALPLKWVFNAVGYNVYTPGSFSGATLCTPGETLASGADCTAVGYYCEGAATSFGCWGRTGPQVLDTLHLSYESLSSNDERGFDALILIIMVLVLKLGYVFVLWSKVSATDSPQKDEWVRRGSGAKVVQSQSE